MKTIDFKKPKYVIPLICLPFVLLLFYAFRIYSFTKVTPSGAHGLKGEVSSVANAVSEKAIEDKLQAFKQRYKKADGYTALGTINPEDLAEEEYSQAYHQNEKHILDSISGLLHFPPKKTSQGAVSQNPLQPLSGKQRRQNAHDAELTQLLSSYIPAEKPLPSKQSDPMAIFRQQMALVDSMNKSTLSQAPVLRPELKRKLMSERPDSSRALKVSVADSLSVDESTIVPEGKKGAFIQAMVEESLTGFNGSRVTIRLQTAIQVGKIKIEKGTKLYAIINGFSAQRVNLGISSIFYHGEILPVQLEVYDLDGIKGIYVPSSTYREFSRELTATAVSGVTMESASDQNQQIRSLLGKIFQSTTGAVNKLIRSNKARIGYPSMLYLVDLSNHK
jgi:conjugative transposon TraM protein